MNKLEADGPEVRESAARQLKFLCQFAWLHPELGPYPPYDDRIRRNLLAALFKSRSRFAALSRQLQQAVDAVGRGRRLARCLRRLLWPQSVRMRTCARWTRRSWSRCAT